MTLLQKIIIAILFGLLISAPQMLPGNDLTGKITKLSLIENNLVPIQNATVQLPKREVTAQIYELQNNFKVGDRVLLYEDAQTNQLTVADFSRTQELLQLLLIFLIVVVLVTGYEALRSIAGLAVSFAVIFVFLLPQIAAGANPLLVTLITSLVIMFFSYYITHGFSLKTSIAIMGTFGAVLLTGILAMIYSQVAKLTGFGSEEASFLNAISPNTNMQNLLVSGMIIGTLGVLDDVTISQASVVQELKKANARLGFRQLFSRAMHVGKDHIASVVNTLVLVYTGASLPLLLLFSGSSQSSKVVDLLNYEMVAEEIVRTLVGSIGLVAAVPITTLIAAYILDKNQKK